MTIGLPSQNGIIVLKTAISLKVVVLLRHMNRGFNRNEDNHLAGFWLGGSPQEAGYHLRTLVTAHGLQEGTDFALTSSVDGVLGPMPQWLQENEDPPLTFSVPGTAGAACQQLRPSRQELLEARERERHAATLSAQRAGEEAALRRWPELQNGDVSRLLGECWALVEFVEASRKGGPARKWVEATFPRKTWYISVCDGYTDELRDALTAYYRGGQSALLLTAVRCRAGQYIAGLELGSRTGTVDLDCYDAWRQRFLATPPVKGASG